MTKEERDMIGQLYTELYDFLIGYALSSLKKESLAEEAVQETFRTACLKPEEVRSSPNPRGWLVKTLKFTINNMKKTQANASHFLAVYTAIQSQELAVSEDNLSLESMYGDIAGSEEFQLLKEMAVEGLSHLEMAEKRGISVDACKKRVQRAKDYLKKKIF